MLVLIIEVYTSLCLHCHEPFFEIDGIVTCPHCNRDAAGAINEGLHASYAVLVNPTTGELALIKV